MLYTSLNFKIHVPEFDPASCRLESTMLFFRNNTTFLLFLYRVRTAQQLQTRSLSLAQFWTFRWTVQIYFCYKLDGSFERKSSNENKNAMENL